MKENQLNSFNGIAVLLASLAASGVSALALFEATQPDIVCMDLRLPGPSGIEVTRQLLALYPDAKVIGLSAHDHLGDIASLIKAGAMGYVSKMNAGDELIEAIRCAGLNQVYISPGLGLIDLFGRS